MRVLLWILGIPVVILALAMLLVPIFLDEQKLVALASEQIEAQTGGTLTVDGGASLSLFPTASLATTGVSLSLPESGTRIEAGSFEAGVALLPLLGLSVEIDNIILEQVTVTSVAADEEAARAAELDTGELSNAELDAFYAVRSEQRKTAGANAAEGAIVMAANLEVGQLALRDIRLLTVDDDDEVISELELKYFTADDLNIAGRPVAFSAEINLPDDEAPMNVVLGGEFTPKLDEETISLDGVSVTVTGATPDPIQVSASGEFALLTQVADLLITLEIGDLKGNGEVRYASFESPQIDAKLALTELNPALLVLAGPEAAEAAADAPETPSEGDTALPLHALRMIDTKAQLSIEKVIVEGHVLSDVDANLRAVDGVVTLDPVTAQVHGGDINFKSQLNGRYNMATMSAEGAVSGLDVGSAVAVMDAGISASGTANLDWTLSGQGATAEDLTGSLSGPISFTTESITVVGIAAEQMICRGVALANQSSLSAEFPTDTVFNDLSAQVQLDNGVATLDPLTAQLTGVGLGGNGTLDITSGELRASFRAQLSEAFGEMDPACAINERYTEMRWPVECKGNLADDPAGWCGVQTAEIIKDLAEGEVKRKVTDEAGKLLNKLFQR